MKIAVVGSKGLPPRQGGIEHHCAEVYSRLAQKGHQVKLFGRSSYRDRRWSARYQYEAVEVVSLPSIPIRGIDAFVNSGLAATIASFQQFDVIHFHASGPAIFSWIPRLLSPATKVVVTCHGLDWQRAKWGTFSTHLLKLGEWVGVRSAHGIGVVSEDLQRYFLSRHHRPTTYIGNAPASYLPSDANFSFVRSQGLEKGRYILFLGRLVPEKRPDLLIKAFNQLNIEGWKLVLVGGNSDTSAYTTELKALAQRGSAQSNNILFTGELRGAQLAEMMRGAGLFVLPSQLEGLPLALLEAMREEVPVLVSDIPVHRQMVGADRGLWFEEGSVDACSATLAWALRNPEFMQQAARRAKQYVQKNYTWDAIAASWLAFYQRQLRIPAVAKKTVTLRRMLIPFLFIAFNQTCS